MSALATALFTAAIALGGKIAFDLWTRLRERRGLAAGLSGEIGAYTGIMIRMNVPENLKALKIMSAEQRQVVLPAMNTTPTGFPVFDEITDKLGVLPPDLVAQVSEFYNAFASMRILVNSLPSPAFIAAPVAMQNARFDIMSDLISRYAGDFSLRDRLMKIAQQDMWCLFAGHA